MELTRKHARKVLEVVDQGLVSGLGTAEPGKLCVEAAICLALGLPHGDNPPCVDATLRSYKIILNDSMWSSKRTRAKGMRRPAVAQLGSLNIDVEVWLNYVVEQTIKQIVPIALRASASMLTNIVSKQKLLDAALECEIKGNRKSALAAAYAAANAAAYAAAYAANAASNAAANAAAYAAVNAAYAAVNAAYAAANAAAEKDRILSLAGEIFVQACILAGTEGSQWLDLCPVE